MATPRDRSGTRARLIITADDFGRDAVCTAAIAAGLAAGSITAASIMANASHFAEACELARRHRVDGKLGVHLVLDEGPALSREMRSFIGDDGGLCVRRTLKPLGRELSIAVESELAAQIERVLAAGIIPRHLDSHRHIHTAFPIGRIVVRLARRYRIPYVRPARNLACRSRLTARIYKWMFNRYLLGWVATADHFGDIVDFFRDETSHQTSGLIECMIHLDESPRGLEGRRLLEDPEFLRFLEDFQLIGRDDTGR